MREAVESMAVDSSLSVRTLVWFTFSLLLLLPPSTESFRETVTSMACFCFFVFCTAVSLDAFGINSFCKLISTLCRRKEGRESQKIRIG